MKLFSRLGKLFRNAEEEENKAEKKTYSKSAEEESTRDFDLNHADLFLREKHEKYKKEFKKIFNKEYEEIQKKAELFENALKEISKADFRKEFGSILTRADKAHLNLLQIHRKNFVEKTQNLLKQIRKPVSDFDSALKYKEISQNLLGEFNKKSMRDYMFFKDLLKRESKEISEKLKELNSAITQFNSAVNEQNRKISQIKEAQNLIHEIRTERELLKNSRKELSTLVNNVKDLKIDLEKLKKQHNLLEKDSDYLAGKEMQKKLQQQLQDVKSKIHSYFTSIERLLKKFNYSTQKSGEITRENVKFLDKLIANPINTLLETKNFASLDLILRQIQTKISKNELNVKNKEKINRKLDEIILQKKFENLISEHFSLQTKLQELEKSKLHEITERKKELDKLLEGVRNSIETKSERIQQLKGHIPEKEQYIKNKIRELKDILDFLGFSIES